MTKWWFIIVLVAWIFIYMSICVCVSNMYIRIYGEILSQLKLSQSRYNPLPKLQENILVRPISRASH